MRSWVVSTISAVVVKPGLESFPHGFDRGFAQPKSVHSVHSLPKGELQRCKDTNKAAAAVRARALIMHYGENACGHDASGHFVYHFVQECDWALATVRFGDFPDCAQFG